MATDAIKKRSGIETRPLYYLCEERVRVRPCVVHPYVTHACVHIMIVVEIGLRFYVFHGV